MTSLNLELDFKDEKKFVMIDDSNSLKFFCHQIRQLFKPIFPSITNKKLVINNQTSLEKIYEQKAEFDCSLEKLNIKNNSILRIDIDDDENFETEIFKKNSFLLLDQQKNINTINESINNFEMKTNNLLEKPKESLSKQTNKENENMNKNPIEEKKEESKISSLKIFYLIFTYDIKRDL